MSKGNRLLFRPIPFRQQLVQLLALFIFIELLLSFTRITALAGLPDARILSLLVLFLMITLF